MNYNEKVTKEENLILQPHKLRSQKIKILNPNYAIEGTEGAALHRMESGFGNQNQIPRYY